MLNISVLSICVIQSANITYWLPASGSYQVSDRFT